MRKKRNIVHTYVQGSISPAQRTHIMDFLGFDPTATPGEFQADSVDFQYHEFHITAVQDVLSSASQLPMHSHSYMEIFRYTSDSQVEYLLGSHRYIVQKGDIICVPPGVFHQVLRYEPADRPCSRELIAITPSALDYMGWSCPPEQYYLLRASDPTQKVLGTFCHLCVEEFQNREFRWRDMLMGYVQILLTQILRNPNSTIKAEPDGLFEQILSYTHHHLNQQLNLTQIAQHFFISERTVTREFQKNLGVSFYRYVTHRRLLMARNLIFDNIPMKEVCARTGFSDYPTFYRAFKKEFGISPRQMKEVGGL